MHKDDPASEQGGCVSELEGAALDAAVAKAEGSPWRKPTHGSCCTCQTCGHGHDNCQCGYSDSWEMAGPIIERERITVQASQAGDWRAFVGDGTTSAGTGRSAREPLVQARADTPLIAAMRAYVAAHAAPAAKTQQPNAPEQS